MNKEIAPVITWEEETEDNEINHYFCTIKEFTFSVEKNVKGTWNAWVKCQNEWIPTWKGDDPMRGQEACEGFMLNLHKDICEYVNEWHSAAERKPEVNTNVLGVCKDNLPQIVWLDYMGDWQNLRGHNYVKVDYWRTLESLNIPK